MRILIVEDEEKLARMLKRGLSREGYAVDYVYDGAEGEKRVTLHEDDYDLIILDLMLPKKDGLTVCKNIRENGITIPILVLTAKHQVEEKTTLLNAGADDYLTKPFSFDELSARINALLRRPNESLPEELRVKDVVLNPATHRVFKGDKEVQLTLKEFALLEYLMRHPGQVLDREHIYNHLWDFANDSLSNVIDVHVKNLRKKLDDNPRQELLQTVRGVGYKLNNK